MKLIQKIITLVTLLIAGLPALAVGIVDHEPLTLQEESSTSWIPGLYISDWSDLVVTLDIMLVIAGIILYGNYLFKRRKRSLQMAARK